MARDLEVEARLTLKDDLSKKAGTALDAVSKKARNAGKAADALAATKKDAGAQAYERTAQDGYDAADRKFSYLCQCKDRYHHGCICHGRRIKSGIHH